MEATITFFATDNMDFVHLARGKDGLTLEEAVREYKKILKKDRWGQPAIGFLLSDEAYPLYSDVHWPLYEGGSIAHMKIGLVPAYRDHPLVVQAVKDMEAYLPGLKRAEQKRKSSYRKER